MIGTIVKIDLVGSKSVSATYQSKNPFIRRQLLEALLETSRSKFPYSSDKYPAGSYYKAEGDAVYFILDRPTVAVRAAIEFMQAWFNVQIPNVETCPDCRIMIDRGDIQTVNTPSGDDFVSPAFENIAVAEKGLEGGGIYASSDVVDHCDKSLARFNAYSSIHPRKGETVHVYRVEFLDPRTIDDSSLLHALFIAQPKSQTARERILEVFLLLYLLQHGSLAEVSDYNRWAKENHYPTLPTQKIRDICAASDYVTTGSHSGHSAFFTLTDDGRQLLEQSSRTFQTAREECLHTVQSVIVQKCGTVQAAEAYDLPQVIEEYLCAVFSEVRMMANYFRGADQLFNSQDREFDKFDYVLRKHLPFHREARYFGEWRTAFLEGLRLVCGNINQYVAAVFHNVLATYYLNRSSSGPAYQTDKMRERQIYLDTNVLYALKVPASQFHDLVTYFVGRLISLDVACRLFPFTVEEYEQSLDRTVKEVKKNEVSPFILRWNPWLPGVPPEQGALHGQYRGLQAHFFSG